MRISDWSSDVCSSDLRGVAVWFFNGDRDLMTHRVVVLADPEAGKPEVVASETIANLPPGTDYEEIKEQFRLSLVEMKALVEDPDLAFPPAAEEPALPSYSTRSEERRVGKE